MVFLKMFRFLVAILGLATLIQAAPQATAGGRIVGGEPTFIEEYPYQVSLQYLLSHLCGAVVVSEDYVLTAAHCTDGYVASEFSIRAGSTFRNSGGIVIQVEAVYQNSNYSFWTINYDISVLRLASPLTFGSTIAPVALPDTNQPIIAGSIGQVSGWGALSEGGSFPSQLQVVELPLVSMEDCIAAYGASSITEKMVCAGYPKGRKDACQQDSGGPLVVNGTLIGLVSWGQGCANPGYPGVYANVPALREYITEVTGL